VSYLSFEMLQSMAVLGFIAIILTGRLRFACDGSKVRISQVTCSKFPLKDVLASTKQL